MTAWLDPSRERPRILVAGSGVAALEACLFLREYVTADDAEIAMLTPAQHFTYRPLSVLEPVGGARTWSMRLDRFASDAEVEIQRDELGGVHAAEHAVTTSSGALLTYDLLLVAIGARPVRQIPGAVNFHGAVDAPAIRRILDDAAARLCRTIVFAVGAGTSWPTPLYELALLAATDLRARDVKAHVVLVTPEAVPLELFGAQASALVARMLDERGIEVLCGAEPLEAEPGHLLLADGRRLTADRVVTLPRAAGRFVDGLPHDPAGFVPVDRHGRVDGAPGVYAAGDITTFPFKQGGLATQQADAAAEAMLSDLGLPIEPTPFTPVLQGVVLGGEQPTYLRTPMGPGSPAPPAPRTYSLWWPPSKIAGRHLSGYLALRAGAPRTPEMRPSADIVPVHVELADAVPGAAGRADAAGS